MWGKIKIPGGRNSNCGIIKRKLLYISTSIFINERRRLHNITRRTKTILKMQTSNSRATRVSQHNNIKQPNNKNQKSNSSRPRLYQAPDTPFQKATGNKTTTSSISTTCQAKTTSLSFWNQANRLNAKQ